MKRVLLISSACLAFGACGPPDSTEGGFDFSIYLSRALSDTISGFQVSVVSKGASLDCVEVQKKCIKDQVAADRFLSLRGPTGGSVKGAFFPLTLVAGTPNTQAVTVSDIAIGKDYAVIVEAVSRGVARLAGSSCNYVKEITAGANSPINARIVQLDPPNMCDPRLQ